MFYIFYAFFKMPQGIFLILYIILVRINTINELKGVKMLKKFVTLIMGITLGVFFVGCSGSVEDISVSFVENAYKGNSDKLIEYVYIPEVGEKALIEGKLKIIVEQAKETADKAGGLKNVLIMSEEIKEDNATVKLRVYFNNGEFKDENVKLISVDGKWKIRL